MPTEHFIPLRKSDLAARLVAMPGLSDAERVDLDQLFKQFSETFHREFHARLESLKDLYAVFDPDLVTTDLPQASGESEHDRLMRLFSEFDSLAERANFRVLTLADLNRALSDSTHWGLNLEVDIEAFERLEIYARGDVVTQRTRHRLRSFFRPEKFDVAMYQRLIVMFRFAGKRRVGRYTDHRGVFIKLFKDIPQLDLDMLLPATSVKMTLVDRAKIFVPTIFGIGLALWKLVQAVFLVAFAGIYGILGLVGGMFGYGVRSFFGYLNTKNKYQLSLTESLYYQNLDNNAGVFFRLLDEAEEQESCEAMLAYFFLWRQADGEACNAAELDGRVEAFLKEAIGRPIDFEVEDGLAKLERLGLIEKTADARYRLSRDHGGPPKGYPAPLNGGFRHDLTAHGS